MSTDFETCQAESRQAESGAETRRQDVAGPRVSRDVTARLLGRAIAGCASALATRASWGVLALGIALMSMLAPSEAHANGICSAANVNAVLENGQRADKIDPRLFYDAAKPHFPVYSKQGQHFAGTDAIIDHWNDNPQLKDPRWLAYILATAYHETAFRMYPVREGLASTDEQAVSILSRSRCCKDKTYWRIVPETGKSYFGRGYVQLTWDYNYKRADLRFGIEESSPNYRAESYYWNPRFALEPDKSIDITYDGMIYGWYTGRCLLQYMQPNRRGDFVQARRVINGMDRADDIAEHAEEFLEIIKEATVPASFRETQEAQQNSSLGADIEDLRAQDADLARTIADLETSLGDRVDAVQASIERERTRFETLTLANERLASDMAGARTELSASRSEIEASRNDLAATQAAIADTQSAIDATRAEIAATQSTIDEARGELAGLRTEVEVVREELRSLPGEFERRVQVLEAAIDAAESDRRINRSATQALEQQIDALGLQISEQSQQITRQNRQLDILVTELEKANNRTMWSYMFGSRDD